MIGKATYEVSLGSASDDESHLLVAMARLFDLLLEK